MKKTNKLLFQLLLVFLIFITESCERKNESITIKNAFEIFDNQVLVADSNYKFHLKFIKQQDSTLIFKKDTIFYTFDIKKINAVFKNDVFSYYDINKAAMSELKLKKFNESEELNNKKEYLIELKKFIENTIVFIEQDFNCADKYQLDVGSFDLTNTIKEVPIKFSSDEFKFKPANEDVALYIEDSCQNILIKVLTTFSVDSVNEQIVFNPIKIELSDKYNNKKIGGVGMLQNELIVNTKKNNDNLNGLKGNKKTIHIEELSLELTNEDLLNPELSQLSSWRRAADKAGIIKSSWRTDIQPRIGEFQLDSKYDKGIKSGQNQQQLRADKQSATQKDLLAKVSIGVGSVIFLLIVLLLSRPKFFRNLALFGKRWENQSYNEQILYFDHSFFGKNKFIEIINNNVSRGHLKITDSGATLNLSYPNKELFYKIESIEKNRLTLVSQKDNSQIEFLRVGSNEKVSTSSFDSNKTENESNKTAE